ncbi:MAG: dihydroorotate dehydrogenase (quinone) [Gammaproteobacteria bacterium]|nr:MAG: dihydroorotate dehydrogenase (quinone) [Gammaproteobacteria bacterium]
MAHPYDTLYRLLRPLLFRLDPERAHALTLGLLRLAGGAAGLGLPAPRRPVEAMGLRFPNPVGLAAGLDKDGRCLAAWTALGFGFIEVGTVTPRPQPGNPRPRLFRIPAERALINRMGFNNEGVDALAARLERYRARRRRVPVGVNLGKNRDTPVDAAAADYCTGLAKVYTLCDYVTINVSSPNTPGLRGLQHGAALAALLDAVLEERERLAARHGVLRPLALKIAPDLDEAALEALLDTVLARPIEALIVANTTLARPAGNSGPWAEAGGLSGAPLFDPATRLLRRVRDRVGRRLALIGVGGIVEPADAVAKLRAGADLVQLYTGLIYRGPGLVHAICRALDACPRAAPPA